MNNQVLTDGDSLEFATQFGINTVTPTGLCVIRGTGEATIRGKKICILGDEKKVAIPAEYTTPTHQIKGTGILTITLLAADQQAECVTTKTPVIVVGTQFTALFTPGSPASDPKLGPDPNPVPTPGTGRLINSQSFVTAG